MNVECNPKSAGVRSKRDDADTRVDPCREFPGIQRGAFPEGTRSAGNLLQFEVGSINQHIDLLWELPGNNTQQGYHGRG